MKYKFIKVQPKALPDGTQAKAFGCFVRGRKSRSSGALGQVREIRHQRWFAETDKEDIQRRERPLH